MGATTIRLDDETEARLTCLAERTGRSNRITPTAQKQIKKLDPQAARRIRHFLEGTLQEITDPRSLGKPLVNQEFRRYRVGDYRLLAPIEDGELVILVVAVAHRREIYRDL